MHVIHLQRESRAEVHESRRRGSGDGEIFAREIFLLFGAAHTIFSCATSLSILDQFHIRNYILVWFFSLFSAVSALLVLSGLRLIWLESFSQSTAPPEIEMGRKICAHTPSEQKRTAGAGAEHTHTLTSFFATLTRHFKFLSPLFQSTSFQLDEANFAPRRSNASQSRPPIKLWQLFS